MRKSTTTLLLVSSLITGVMTASSLYAKGSQGQSGSKMRQGMMGDMIGMMKMMRQMSNMVDHCNTMMSDNRPKDEWRTSTTSELKRKG
jgi:hypothetical protein